MHRSKRYRQYVEECPESIVMNNYIKEITTDAHYSMNTLFGHLICAENQLTSDILIASLPIHFTTARDLDLVSLDTKACSNKAQLCAILDYSDLRWRDQLALPRLSVAGPARTF